MKFNSFCLFLISCRSILAQTCYYPGYEDASIEASPVYTPCSSDVTKYSTCCKSDHGHQCLDNGLCLDPTQRLYQGGCTNKNWDNCPDICLSHDPEDSITIKHCETGNFYCCQSDSPTAGNCCLLSERRISALNLHRLSRRSYNDDSSTDGALAAGITGGVVGAIGLVGICFVAVIYCQGIPISKGGMFNRRRSAAFNPILAEADAGPESVLVESDARPVQPTTVHELPA
ncbi:hypothetical protein FPOA_09410 [Fusarium poae]|uniref:Mid2 domain-containing protein n=1 Tax=Fusarium poae TaxID=36050 RepID=A0A1B8AB49_FUSPO|nr:hypothetical protein FPOA_09410 [Fusarium poae]